MVDWGLILDKFVILLLNTGGQTLTVKLSSVMVICTYFPTFSRYYKVKDVASWINVDRNTGELRVANTIDRESPFVTNGTYTMTMKAVDSSKLLINAVHLLF